MKTHALVVEFPEYIEVINELRRSDMWFAEKAKEYHQLDHKIVALEERDVPISDALFMALKSRRVHLKDWLFEQIQYRARH
ncbi:YdcH family protein [Paraferrimonas sp. SM1919]|uniref:YdcH family protein n=1 Tax=Paraferrimonas sp. SM1919 TaxID=2662263 RepID=UPI001F088CED|nr:YdcH family protein [Paraferrimonas sp. SM1919]